MHAMPHLEPDWVRDVVWWHVYPLGFTGVHPPRDGAPAHALRRLIPWLDYAQELGATGLMLGPVFESRSHGYDTRDHFRIDPRLGDDADFDALVAALRARVMRLMLDGVFNHVSRDHPALARAQQDPHADWFRREHGELVPFEGHGDLITLDHDHPAVADLVTGVMTHWLDRGADAWRLDAAYAVPAPFWAGVLARVRDRHPDAYVMAEVLHGDYADYVARSGVDSLTQYELWKAIWSSLNDANFFELDWALRRHNEFTASFAPSTFIGNHDVTRIASQLTDHRHLAHAVVLLATLPGTPAVYAGDEQGFTGVKQDGWGADDAIRPAFPDRPEPLAAPAAAVFDLHRRLLGLRRRHRWLHRATTAVWQLSNPHLVLEVRGEAGSLVVALNTGDDPLRHRVPGWRIADSDTGGTGIDGDLLHVSGHGWAVLEPA